MNITRSFKAGNRRITYSFEGELKAKKQRELDSFIGGAYNLLQHCIAELESSKPVAEDSFELVYGRKLDSASGAKLIENYASIAGCI